PVWGWAEPGEEVTIQFGDQTQHATADDQGKWKVTLEPLSLGEPRSLVVEAGNRVEVSDILVGDVWLCSGQSNMEWNIRSTSDGDLEVLGDGNPQIRFLTVAMVGSQQPLDDF